MENATKALLIAAAVLIAIVLVALGVNLLSSTGKTTEDAGEVAEQIGSSTNSAVSSVETALGKLEGKDMITFYIIDEGKKYTCSCPRGYTFGRAKAERYLDERWDVFEDEVMQIEFNHKNVVLMTDDGVWVYRIYNYITIEEGKEYKTVGF